MNTIEEIKALYSAPYDVKKLAQFKKVMMESVDAFSEVIIHIDKFDRTSDEFKIITKYHIESYSHNQKYEDMYESVVEKILNERNQGELTESG